MVGFFIEFFSSMLRVHANCNPWFCHSLELENRLLSRFDAASQKRDLSTMGECAKILSQVSFFFLQSYAK